MDNYGRKAKVWLPTIKIKGEPGPVVEVINEKYVKKKLPETENQNYIL